MEDPSPHVRSGAAASLTVAARYQAAERGLFERALVRLLADADAEVRTEAARALIRFAASECEPFRPESIERLCSLARTDPEPRVRANATRALAWGPTADEKQAVLVAALVDASCSVRDSAVDVIANIGVTEPVIPAIRRALETPEAEGETQQDAQKLPASERLAEVLAPLEKRLKRAINRARRDGLEEYSEVDHLLCALGPAAVAHLRAVMSIWFTVAFPPEDGIAATGHQGAVELVRILREGTPREREAAADALTPFVGNAFVNSALGAAMRDEDEAVRAVAAAGLGSVAAGLYGMTARPGTEVEGSKEDWPG